MSGEARNKRGELLDMYGKKTVYEGERLATGERYKVWHGVKGGMRSESTTYRSLAKAIRVAQKYQRKGYDVKITDRLIQEEENN